MLSAFLTQPKGAALLPPINTATQVTDAPALTPCSTKVNNSTRDPLSSHFGNTSGYAQFPAGSFVYYSATLEHLKGFAAKQRDVGVVFRSSGTVGVYQYMDGEWLTLYSEAEATKKFGKSGTKGKKTGYCCACGDKLLLSDLKVDDDEYYCDACWEDA